jgi:chromosome segregation protein
MHIKKLEISGFKSFVDRTVVHFDHDIVGIVGPNGCGKSNIVDAIRWCMGEQSAKHLRGRSMTDVIFAGSSTRGAHGMAEVTLTFDNSDPETAQGLPLEFRDYAEIAVTRRLYRDGTSEYLVNKTVVRLKDITDLFLGTGVGTKAYSIIEQGKVGLIVSARAEDRRMIIEEAAGITKYKARRKQAEQKMEQTRQNLLRVGDIVNEIERNLASLKRQAAKAERYINYKNELEDLSLCEASHKLLELTVCADAQESLRSESSERALELTTDLARREAEIEVKRQGAHAIEDLAETAQTESYRANNEVQTLESEIRRGRDRFAELSRRSASASAERADLTAQITEVREEHDGLLDALEAAEEEEARGEEAAAIEAGKLSELRTAEEAAERTSQEIRRKASQAQAEVARLEATLRGFEQRFSDMTHRRESLEDEDGRLSLELEDHEARAEGASERVAGLHQEKLERTERRDALTAELKTAREATVGLDKEVDHAKHELSQRRNRLRALEELHARMEGVGQGPKTLVASKDPCVVGLVGDRFETRAEDTLALAAALGDKLEWVIVSDLARGSELLRELDAKKKGRATIVPRHPRFVAGSAPFPAGIPGVVGRLADRVFCDPADRPLLASRGGDPRRRRGPPRADRHAGRRPLRSRGADHRWGRLVRRRRPHRSEARDAGAPRGARRSLSRGRGAPRAPGDAARAARRARARAGAEPEPRPRVGDRLRVRRERREAGARPDRPGLEAPGEHPHRARHAAGEDHGREGGPRERDRRPLRGAHRQGGPRGRARDGDRDGGDVARTSVAATGRRDRAEGALRAGQGARDQREADGRAAEEELRGDRQAAQAARG